MIYAVMFFLLFSHDPAVGPVDGPDSLKMVLSESVEEDEDISENLDELAGNPVDINSTSPSEWKRIPFLLDIQVDSIITRRSVNGSFKNIRELETIVGPQTFALIKPYLTLRKPMEWSFSFIQTSQISHPVHESIANGTWLGNPLVSTTRIRASLGSSARLGLISAKDAGEPGPADHLGGFVSGNGKRLRWIIGDFKVSTGSGLVYADPYGNVKSRLATLPFRSASFRISPALSRSGTAAQRGVFLELKPSERFILCGFQAWNRRDASMLPHSSIVTGISPNTYHRSAGERDRRDRIKESHRMFLVSWVAADRARLHFSYTHMDFLPGIRHSFDILGESKRRALYAFSGNTLSLYALSCNLDFRPLSFSGETVFSEHSGPAFSNSLFIRNKKIRTGIRHWYIPRSYQSPYGQSFDGSAGFPRGVSGWYLAAQLNPLRSLHLNAYRILKKDLWRTYFEPLPAHSADWLIASEIRQRGRSVTLSVRSSLDETYAGADPGQPVSSFIRMRQARAELTVHASGKLRFRYRWEAKWKPDGRETGTNMFQDIRMKLGRGLDLNTRASSFKTPDYSLRIYEYESDLPFVFSNFPLYGTGYKYYVLINWRRQSSIQLSGKWRYLRFDDGNGTRVTRDFKVMVRWER